MTRESVHVLSREWQTALFGALILHVALLVGGSAVSRLLDRPKPMPPVYTVDLFRVQDLPAKVKTEMPRAESPKTEKPQEAQKKKETPTKPVAAPPPKPAKQAAAKPVEKVAAKPIIKAKKEAVSLKPLPAKAKAKAPVKAAEKPAPRKPSPEELLAGRLKRVEERVQERREEALIQERLAQLKARQDAKSQGGGSSSGGEAIDKILRDYLKNHVYPSVRRNWALPEQLLRQSGLVCVVVIRIAADGTVVKNWLEQGSGVTLFDQSVLRAIQKATPLAELPRELRPGPLEVGIRFRPGSVGM